MLFLFIFYSYEKHPLLWKGSGSTMLKYEDLINDVVKDLDETLELINDQVKEIEKLYELLSQQ